MAEDIYNTETGEIFGEAGDEVDEKIVENLRNNNFSDFSVIITSAKYGPFIRNTIVLEKMQKDLKL